LYSPNIFKLTDIYKFYGEDFADRILPSISNEVVKSVLSETDLENVFKNRMEISRRLNSRIIERSKEFEIIVHDISITNIEVSPESKEFLEKKFRK
jgi:regulator of protease activity HflC (stomatin/prohibitin superfamily)